HQGRIGCDIDCRARGQQISDFVDSEIPAAVYGEGHERRLAERSVEWNGCYKLSRRAREILDRAECSEINTINGTAWICSDSNRYLLSNLDARATSRCRDLHNCRFRTKHLTG